MAKNAPLRVLVTGDWVADWNLARPQDLPEGYFDGSSMTQLAHRAGGAWYVAHLIQRVTCRDLVASQPGSDLPQLSVETARAIDQSRPTLKADGSLPSDLAYAYSVWWKHPRTTSAKKEDEVWRIGRFAGCRRGEPWIPRSQPATGPLSDILVIDDLNLGFSSDPRALERALADASSTARIVLKHGVQPAAEGALPQLLKTGGVAERLWVVLSASSLRQRNAMVSRALSWDQALEDLEAEFRSGPSSRDLARVARVVVHFGLAGASVFDRGTLHRFYFLPNELEGIWEDERPGRSFGTASVLTAALVRHCADPGSYPLFFAITQALAAQRAVHHEGAGAGSEFDIDFGFGSRISPAAGAASRVAPSPPGSARLRPPQKNDQGPHLDEIRPFRMAWNTDEFQIWPPAAAPSLARSRLLCNITGTTPESLMAKAAEVVVQGVDAALASVPKAAFGNFKTVDREEIESANEIRRLILEYQKHPADKRPLSIAVFGAPGSGKSFAIKEIGKSIFGKDREPLEFNLTQIKTPADLHRAFHQVRDASIRHEIPLVFWDEFDTGGLQWLADFLAPMQDAEFFDGSHKHPFGKCIFVFAGATSTTFSRFKAWPRSDERPEPEGDNATSWSRNFTDVKGPDFVSRLRGFVDVKGPNPVRPQPGAAHFQAVQHDPAYVLRRAMMLRSEIERNFPDLIDAHTKRVRIAANVLHAFLSVERYEHGARSLSALLTMSGLSHSKQFNSSAIPSPALASLHVSHDFFACLQEPASSEDLLLCLARAGHNGYRKERAKTEPEHSDNVDWEQLEPKQRHDNVDPVPRRLLALLSLGYAIVPAGPRRSQVPAKKTTEIIEHLIEPEHRIWLSRRLAEGWEHAAQNQRHLRLNTDILAFSKLKPEQQAINRAIIREMLAALQPAGYSLVSVTPPKQPRSRR